MVTMSITHRVLVCNSARMRSRVGSDNALNPWAACVKSVVMWESMALETQKCQVGPWEAGFATETKLF